MKTITLSVAVVALLASGCSHERSGLPLPTGPSSSPPPVPPQAPPPPGSGFSPIYSEIAVGQVVHGAPRPNDPECPYLPGFKCQHFRVTPAADGHLTVVMNVSLGPATQVLDLSLMAPNSRTWWLDRTGLEAPVSRGETYEITVWYLTAGVQFDFRTSLG